MSVSSTDNKVIYTGSGTTGPFDFNFPIFESSNLVIERYAISDGSTTTFAETTNYSVSIDADGTGSVTLVAALTSAYKLIITRVIPLTQEIQYVEGDKFPSASHERGLDRAVMRDQQLQEQLDRAVLQNPLATTTVTLPTPVTGNALVWTASGQLENSDEALVGPTGPTGPAGPAGSGSGDVLGPATNTDLKVPQWDGANTKTLKDGLTVGTAANNLVQLNGSAQLPAVSGALLTNLPSALRAYAGSLTRDFALSSGNVAYTGVGFTPKAIIALTQGGTLNACWGLVGSAGGNGVGFEFQAGGALVDADFIYLQDGSSNGQSAVLASYDADGFTLTWTKFGSPTGSKKVCFLALG
jgi:hypothetical protein